MSDRGMSLSVQDNAYNGRHDPPHTVPPRARDTLHATVAHKHVPTRESHHGTETGTGVTLKSTSAGTVMGPVPTPHNTLPRHRTLEPTYLMDVMSVRHRHIFALLGLALGTFGLANAWRLAGATWKLGAYVTHGTDLACSMLGTLAVILWASACSAESVAGRSPLSSTNVLGLPFWGGLAVGAMGITSASTLASVASGSLSTAVWFSGATLQFGILVGASLAALVTMYQRWAAGLYPVFLRDFTPMMYPVTVGVGITAPTKPVAVHSHHDLARQIVWVYAWAACLFTAVFTVPIVMQLVRVAWVRGKSMVESVPVAVVQMAPFGVAFTAFVHADLPTSHQRLGVATLMLVGGNVASTALMVVFVGPLWRMSFAPTWSALTFPAVSSAIGIMVYRGFDGHSEEMVRALDGLGMAYLALASGVVLLVWARLFIHLAARVSGPDTEPHHVTETRPLLITDPMLSSSVQAINGTVGQRSP
eukprot:m.51221 g.51221  ORF g.51221 m.51221 type:complete len:476 (+) comp7291_c0_seq1:266-1693(+)